MYSAYKVNKQGDSVLLSQFWTSQLFHIRFWLTSGPMYRFLSRQVRWSGIPMCFRIFHSFFVIHTIFSCKNTKIATRCNHWQENVETHQKRVPHIQGQRSSCNRTVGEVQSHLKSNLIPTRDAWRAQTKPCMHQDLGIGTVNPTRKWARPAFGCLSLPWNHGSDGLPRGQGLWQQLLGGTACGASPARGCHH